MVRAKWGARLKREFFWFLIRLVPLVAIQTFIELAFRMNWFFFLGFEEITNFVYDILSKFSLTLYVLFFYAVFKRFLLPLVEKSATQAVKKFIKEPLAARKIRKSLRQCTTYFGYLVVIIALICIWAYSYLGVWLIGGLGTSLIIILTFVLGLFTSSILGNVLAYWVLGNISEFKRGDRVQIGDAYGDIVDLGTFFTKIKTIKDEIVSIPNLTIMGKNVKNFSALKAVLIPVSVTLGYNVDKDEAKRILIRCAEKTRGITRKKRPFVLLRDLGKYTVTYEINAYTNKPNELVEIKSELIDNILAEFRRSKIELLSPTYVTLKETS